MKFKIFFLIFIIAFGTLAYFGYPIIKNRYFGHKTIEIKNDSIQQKSDIENINSKIDTRNTMEETKSSTLDVTILPSDCDNNCKNFQKNDTLKYCKQVCEIPNTNPEGELVKPIIADCTNVSGLQKDYCLKNLAVKNKDYKTCDHINDAGIKKACKNRITEDILENQL